ncbi:MAG TPA: hypothetical protein VJN18_09960 [Polyangiaceae bacterium]|nr:hypothetical protein [Polyangiaceae bacterium]
MTRAPRRQAKKLDVGSEIPTERVAEQAASAARIAAARLGAVASKAAPAEEVWCDSEAPTRVAAERPILPRSPRLPRV